MLSSHTLLGTLRSNLIEHDRLWSIRIERVVHAMGAAKSRRSASSDKPVLDNQQGAVKPRRSASSDKLVLDNRPKRTHRHRALGTRGTIVSLDNEDRERHDLVCAR
jgi:hypothetical protein